MELSKSVMGLLVTGIMLGLSMAVWAQVDSMITIAPRVTGTEIQTTESGATVNSITASTNTSGHPAADANDNSISTFWEAPFSSSTSHYSDTTQSTGVFVNGTRPLVAVNANVSSVLIGDQINEMELTVRKVGNPPSAAELGVFRANLTTTEQVDQGGSITTAVSTSDGPPEIAIHNGDITVNVDEGEAIGERANTIQSLIYQFPVNSIEAVRLAKTGTPLGDVSIGVMNSTGKPSKVFATVNASTLSTSTFASYGGSGTEYFVPLGEAIGIWFNGTGSQTTGATATFTNSTTQNTGTSLITLNSGGNTIIGERADTSSALINDVVNALEVRLLRSTTTTTGTVTLGVFNSAGSTVYTFCTLDATQLSTAQTQVLCVNETATRTIALNDRIGVKYESGDGSNNIQVATSGSNPFDGTTSYREVWTGSWTATTSSDLRFQTADLHVKQSGSYSLDFDGSNNFVTLNTNGIIFNNTSTMSIFADISPDTAKDEVIISNKHIANQYGFGLALNTNRNLIFEFYPVDGSGLKQFVDSRNVTLGTFSRVGAMYNGTHTTFCIDRVCQLDNLVLGGVTTIESNPIQYIRIGHREQAGAASERFDGNIDNVRLYSAFKTSTQAINIQEGYNDVIGLQSVYDFDDGVSAYTTDRYGKADGIISGGQLYENGYGVGSYIRVRISNTESFDHTSTDLRTTYATYDIDNPGWVPDATRDMKLVAHATTRIAASSIDNNLTSFWQNANPATINSTTTVLDYTKLVGANYHDDLLSALWVNADNLDATPQSTIRPHFQEMKDHGLNYIRVPMHWEAYEANPVDFLTTVENIAIVAQEEDMLVLFDNHHWYLSSRVTNDVGSVGGIDCGSTGGSGFPEFIITHYDNAGADQLICYERDGDLFWNDWWTNTVTYNGTDAWEDLATYLKAVINRVDQYDSVVAYEPLNEPHFWSNSHYTQAGNFYQRMYNELREVTQKDIHITRETAQGQGFTVPQFQRSPANEHLIFPDPPAFGLVYQPHHYNVATLNSQMNSVSDILDDVEADGHPRLPVLWGEFGIGCNVSPETEDAMRTFLSTFAGAGHGWTYWKWNNEGEGCTTGRSLVHDNLTPYPALNFMDTVLPELYTLPVSPYQSGSGSGSGLTTDFIYLNFTNALNINSVVLRHQHADFIPDGVKLYISNSTTSWGTADETATLTSTTGNQTITVSPAQVGKYLKLEPTSFSNARTWRLQMVDAGQVPPNPTVTVTTSYQIIPIKVFGTIQPAAVTTSFQPISRTLVGENYTIAEGDYLGIHFEGNSPNNYFEVMTDTNSSNPFDGSNTKLVYVQNNTTQFFSDSDLTGNFRFTVTTDLPTIYVDIGANQTISRIEIYKPDGATIPTSVDIDVASNIDDDTGEIEFTEVLDNHVLIQSTGTEIINIPDTTGHFIQIRVNTQGAATSTKVAEFDPYVTESEVIQTIANQQAINSLNNVKSTVWTALTIASVAYFLTLIGMFVVPGIRGGGFSKGSW